ncbi:MAG: YdcF family protein [Deltaproteobacteria bacterium]|nr:YdcF family protein [Deltaproteobacteria bacterium]
MSLTTKSLFIISFGALFVFIFSAIWLNSEYSDAFRTDLKHLILSELIYINPLPSGTKVNAIYVLGGSQTNIEHRYKTASELYHKGICERIWILSRPGITEYSVSLGRNLTNNEWSILKLTEFGVPTECIEPIEVKEGFFGTFTEAKGISSLIKKRGYKSLLLISSPEHLCRAEISFDKFLKDQNTSIYACPVKSGFYLTGVEESDSRALLRDLLVEFIKLKVYQYLLVR